jgi:hypothetical protein
MWTPIEVENQWGIVLNDLFPFKGFDGKLLLFLRKKDAQSFCDVKNQSEDCNEPKKPSYLKLLLNH